MPTTVTHDSNGYARKRCRTSHSSPTSHTPSCITVVEGAACDRSAEFKTIGRINKPLIEAIGNEILQNGHLARARMGFRNHGAARREITRLRNPGAA
ncbi:hypothetical protein GCM10009860_09150 [Microbacterium mitrae]